MLQHVMLTDYRALRVVIFQRVVSIYLLPFFKSITLLFIPEQNF